MNDLGTVYDLGGKYTEAIETIQQAIVIAEQRSPQDLPSVLCNLASVKMHTGNVQLLPMVYFGYGRVCQGNEFYIIQNHIEWSDGRRVDCVLCICIHRVIYCRLARFIYHSKPHWMILSG